jgi:pimeloyl-ACP methyl ester carboxylesterase
VPDPPGQCQDAGVQPTPTRFAGSEGIDLAADVSGEPDAWPVLLMHGGGQTRHAWGTAARTLAEHGWRAVSLDLRGHGDSEWAPDGDYSFRAFADDAIAAYTPNRPRRMNPTGLMKVLRQRPDGRWYWHWDPAFMARGRTEVPGQDYQALFEAALDGVRIPTLLVVGKLSDVVTAAGTEEFLARIPGAKHVDVRGASHMVAGDQNDAFADAVIAFLEHDVRPTLPG